MRHIGHCCFITLRETPVEGKLLRNTKDIQNKYKINTRINTKERRKRDLLVVLS